MMKNDEEIIKSLIKGGFVGAFLGALLSKDKEEGASLGALAGAAILATYKANELAMKANVPMYVKENGSLFLLQPDGSKTFIRQIDKSGEALPQHFKLK